MESRALQLDATRLSVDLYIHVSSYVSVMMGNKIADGRRKLVRCVIQENHNGWNLRPCLGAPSSFA